MLGMQVNFLSSNQAKGAALHACFNAIPSQYRTLSIVKQGCRLYKLEHWPSRFVYDCRHSIPTSLHGMVKHLDTAQLSLIFCNVTACSCRNALSLRIESLLLYHSADSQY